MKNEDPKITDLLKKRIEKERKETRAALKADDFLTPKEVAQLFYPYAINKKKKLKQIVDHYEME